MLNVFDTDHECVCFPCLAALVECSTENSSSTSNVKDLRSWAEDVRELFKDVSVKVWRGNYDVEVDRLGSVVIRLWIEIQGNAILVNSCPEIASVDAEHDISDPLGNDDLLVNEVIHEFLGERNTLFHL